MKLNSNLWINEEEGYIEIRCDRCNGIVVKYQTSTFTVEQLLDGMLTHSVNCDGVST
jgi:hypothetical protein